MGDEPREDTHRRSPSGPYLRQLHLAAVRRKRALAACLLTALLVLLAVADSRQRQRHSPANRDSQASWGAIVHIQPDAPEASQQTAEDSADTAGSTARLGDALSDGGSGAGGAATAGSAAQTGRQGSSSLLTDPLAGLPQGASRQVATHRALEGADPQTGDIGGASIGNIAVGGRSDDRRPAVFLFAGVLSGRGYRHRRLAVREAWAHRAQARPLAGSLRHEKRFCAAHAPDGCTGIRPAAMQCS